MIYTCHVHHPDLDTGIMTNLCCESTARDAYYRDHRVFFPADATGTINEEMHLASLMNLAFGFAQVTTADGLLQRIQSAQFKEQKTTS